MTFRRLVDHPWIWDWMPHFIRHSCFHLCILGQIKAYDRGWMAGSETEGRGMKSLDWKERKRKNPRIDGMRWRPPDIPILHLSLFWQDLPSIPRLRSSQDDKIVWTPAPSGNFSLASTWNSIRSCKPVVSWSSLIWFKGAVPRYSFIAWLAINNGLMTRDKLLEFGTVNTNTCVLCNGSLETVHHLFFECQFSRAIWDQVLSKSGLRYSSMLGLRPLTGFVPICVAGIYMERS